MSVCVVGSFMMELVVVASRRPKAGETLIGDSFSMFVGGKGFNQAVATKRAGSEVSMIGCLGQDAFADKFIQFMKEEGIDFSGVDYDEEVGTGTATPLVERSGQNSIIIVPQANMRITQEQIETKTSILEQSDVVVLQLEIPMEIVKYVAKKSKELGKTVVLNPAPYDKLDDELLENIDFIIPNETELLGLIPQCDILDIDSIVSHVKDFQKKVPLNFVVTLGERGVISIDKHGQVLSVEPHYVTPIDTVGAGDTFCGYFASSLAEGKTLQECLQFANKAASISVTRRGAATSVPLASEVKI